MGTYRYVDLAPLGRNEKAPADWWRRHDQYEEDAPGVARPNDELRGAS